jgi:hypothetical protein
LRWHSEKELGEFYAVTIGMRFFCLIDNQSENLTDPSPACFMGIARQDLTSVSAEFISQIGLVS